MAKVKIDHLARTINDGLAQYSKLTNDEVKRIVRKTGNTVRKEIKETAPRDTGKYADSWSVRKIAETANTLYVTVCSYTRYQLAHLLEKGHAKRGGGRVEARPHIAEAEQKAVAQMEAEIEKKIGGIGK